MKIEIEIDEEHLVNILQHLAGSVLVIKQQFPEKAAEIRLFINKFFKHLQPMNKKEIYDIIELAERVILAEDIKDISKIIKRIQERGDDE